MLGAVVGLAVLLFVLDWLLAGASARLIVWDAGAGAGVGVGAGAVGVNEINLENEVLDLLLLLADHGAVDIREALITGGGGSGSVQAAVPAILPTAKAIRMRLVADLSLLAARRGSRRPPARLGARIKSSGKFMIKICFCDPASVRS